MLAVEVANSCIPRWSRSGARPTRSSTSDGGEDPERAKKVALVAAPLARIQSKSGRGTLVAWKEHTAHPAAEGRTEKVLGAVSNISDVLDPVHRFISLR